MCTDAPVDLDGFTLRVLQAPDGAYGPFTVELRYSSEPVALVSSRSAAADLTWTPRPWTALGAVRLGALRRALRNDPRASAERRPDDAHVLNLLRLSCAQEETPC